MRKKYYGYSKQGGVYKITNLKNGKIYIGSAKCFQVRASQHQTQLRNNKHQNKHLQASWNKWGEDAFLFEVIEVAEGTKENRFEVEQKHIDALIKEGKWETTFNFKKKTAQRERSCFSRTPEETSKKRSKNAKRLWADPVWKKQMVKKLACARKGVGLPEKTKRILSISMKQKWETGEAAERFKNPEFIEKMREIAKQDGRMPSFKGKKHSEAARKKIGKASKERWKNEEYCQRITNKQRGKTQTKETIEKRSEALRGRKISAETRMKISKANKGRKRTPEQIEKMRQAQLGKKLSVETRKKISEGNKGRSVSQETRKKISKAKRRQ